MTADHDRYATWDGAYVLGALSSSERAEFEAHLARCAACREAVGEVAPTAGLLSRLTPERARAIESGSPPTPAPELRGRVVRTARRRRRRSIVVWAAASAAAVLVIAVPGLIAANLSAPDPQGTVYALDDVGGAPLEASVKLTETAWGTRIDLVCKYTGHVLDAPPGGWPYALAVTDASGHTSVLSTWRADPGTTTELSAGTDLGASSIDTIEIRSTDGDRVVMRRDLGTP